jgi:DNA-binding NarL/FixJ family response regulator
MMREGLKALIGCRDDMQIVGETDNGRDTVRIAQKAGAHLVVMDVGMPDLNGIEATRQLMQAQPNVKVVALSGHANKQFVREMLQAGAFGYVLKQRAPEELLHAISEVMAGNKYLSPDVARGVVDDYIELSSSISDNPAFIVLTDREREVLQQIAEGVSTKEIADVLGVSVKTVETHRRNIMEKLDLHSIAELTKYAIREGVTTVDT